MQLSMNVNKVDRNFLINIKEKLQEQLSQKIKNLIQLRDHIDLYFLELKKLEVNVNLYENILNPIKKQVKRENKKLSETSNEKLQALNIVDRVELISTINYPIRRKWVCQEINNNVVKQL